MEKNEKVLFVTEKWCDANPSMGLTNNYHNLFSTFKNRFPDNKYSIIHIDEYALRKKKAIDNFLIQHVEKTKPSYIIFSLLGRSSLNPEFETLALLREKGSKIIVMWPDVFPGWGINEIKSLNESAAVDLHVCWGNESNISEKIDNLIWLWAPQDETLYYPSEEKISNVSFLGSVRYPERQKYLKHLLLNAIEVLIDGGQREKGLPPTKYAELMRKSKISLNFPQGPDGVDQCKGRVWEIIASKSLLFERKNDKTSMFLVPSEDYVEFENEEDLVNKINFFLDNEDKMCYIIENAYRKYKSLYTSDVFWDKVFSELKNEL